MKKIILLIMLSLATLNADYRVPVKLPSITFPIAVDKDFRVMQRNCQWCHSYGYILNQGKQSKEYWNKIVVRMRDVFKAPITKKDEKTVTEYLFKHYGVK
ncbi:sulfite:cytochrome C oxidoreductase subunit B [Sulfurimonas sp.]